MNNSEEIKDIEKLLNGVTKLCSTVAVTLGPKGRNVVINQNNTPVITNDGVTIAKAFKCQDKIENIGCEIAKQASIQTNQKAGDGTTTALVLTKSLLENGLQLINEKVNPVALKEGMMLASNKVCELIKQQAKQVKDITDLMKVATLSSANKHIAGLVASGYMAVGKDGIVVMQDSPLSTSTLTVKKGFQINYGLLSPYFLTDNNSCKFTNARIAVSNTKLSDISALVSVLEYCHNNNLPLVIFAPQFSEELVKTIIVNKLNNYINIALISVSSLTGEFENISNDLCALTGAQLITLGNLVNITPELLGTCENFESNYNSSIFTNDNASEKFRQYVLNLYGMKEHCEDEYEKLKLKKRLGMLSNGIAIINVGASTDIERTEVKLRIEDAIESTKNAIKDGVVSGGGMALFKCITKLKKYINTITDPEVKMGAMLVLNSLSCPVKQLAVNCGVDADKLIKKLNNNLKQKPNYCFNASTNRCVADAFKEGIVDACSVPVTALENAVSVTATLLSTIDVVL